MEGVVGAYVYTHKHAYEHTYILCVHARAWMDVYMASDVCVCTHNIRKHHNIWYIRVGVCMYVCRALDVRVCIYTQTCVHIHVYHICMRVRVCMEAVWCVREYTHTHMHIYKYIWYTHVRVPMYVWMALDVCVWMCVCVYTHKHVYT